MKTRRRRCRILLTIGLRAGTAALSGAHATVARMENGDGQAVQPVRYVGVPARISKRRLASLCLQVPGLSVFDDLDHRLAARLAPESAPVVMVLVRLDADQPHRRSASFAGRVSYFQFAGVVVKVAHNAYPESVTMILPQFAVCRFGDSIGLDHPKLLAAVQAPPTPKGQNKP